MGDNADIVRRMFEEVRSRSRVSADRRHADGYFQPLPT